MVMIFASIRYFGVNRFDSLLFIRALRDRKLLLGIAIEAFGFDRFTIGIGGQIL